MIAEHAVFLAATVPVALALMAAFYAQGYRRGFAAGKRRTIERLSRDGALDVRRIVDMGEFKRCVEQFDGLAARLKAVSKKLNIGGEDVRVTVDVPRVPETVGQERKGMTDGTAD